MKILLALLATTAISLAGGGCGSTSRPPRPASTVAASTTDANRTEATKTEQIYTKADADHDNDVGAPSDDTNNNSVLDYGDAASTADEQAVTKLIKRYYAAAVAGNGSGACSMLISTLAEAVAEDYGHGSAGPRYLSSGTTCPSVMKLLFEHSHTALLAAVPSLKVTRVRVMGHGGLAIISFGAVERQAGVIREGHTWKVTALLDSEIP
jgi:hypothetical protein